MMEYILPNPTATASGNITIFQGKSTTLIASEGIIYRAMEKPQLQFQLRQQLQQFIALPLPTQTIAKTQHVQR
jgi:hypothetical protein